MAKRRMKIDRAPDFGRLEKVLRREGKPDRVPFYELFSNIEPQVMEMIDAGPCPVPEDSPRSSHVHYQYALGYDYVNVGGEGFGFPREKLKSTQTTEGERSYVMAADATITNREDFEKYPWPVMTDVDWSAIEKVGDTLPEGMRVITMGPGASSRT